MEPDVLMWIFGQLIVAAAIWGGIRADIKSIHSRIDRLEDSNSHAHKRLDNHIDRS